MRPERNLFRRWPLALIPIRHWPAVRYFGVVSLRQCSSYASVRVQRLFHLLQLQKLLYNERTLAGLLRNMYGRWYRDLLRPRLRAAFGSGLLISAIAFSFADNGITDDEMMRAAQLFSSEEGVRDICIHSSRRTPDSKKKEVLRESNTGAPKVAHNTHKWEPLITKDHFHLYRRSVSGHPSMYEYRCTGTYSDITPTAFFIAQMDLEYRKQWDRLVISLNVVDVERDSGSEVVHWVTHFPYPMYPREYVYVRRACVDTKQGTFVLTSKSVDHPSCPRDESKRVRVDTYYSCMVVKAHKSVDENGFDYVLMYFDDPKSPFPQVAYNWMVNTGVLGYLEKVHHAAKALSTKRTVSSEQQQQASNATAQQVANWQRLISERYNYSF